MPPEQIQRALDFVHFAFNVGTHDGTRSMTDGWLYLRKTPAKLKPLG